MQDIDDELYASEADEGDDRPEHVCVVCGYRWRGRGEAFPMTCANRDCRSKYWDGSKPVDPKVKCLYPDCGHEWTPRSTKPPRCPRCMRLDWDVPHDEAESRTFKHKCLRCGYEWENKDEHPATCRRCRRASWNTPFKYGRA